MGNAGVSTHGSTSDSSSSGFGLEEDSKENLGMGRELGSGEAASNVEPAKRFDTGDDSGVAAPPHAGVGTPPALPRRSTVVARCGVLSGETAGDAFLARFGRFF
jgi:hypothetical protein